MAAAAGPAPNPAPDPDKGHDVRRMFDRIAPRYDLLNTLLSLGIDRRWRRQAVAAALATEPGRILDVATGTADLALALARARPQAHVVAVDFSEAMLRVGRAKAQRAGLAIDFEVADGSALPYANASFDVITIAYGLRNFADPDAGLREFRRVLAPGGRLVVLEFPPPPANRFGRLFRRYFTRLVPLIGGLISGDSGAYAYLPASVLAFPAPEELARRMERHGFENVSWTPQTLGVSALHTGSVPAATPPAGNEEEDT